MAERSRVYFVFPLPQATFRVLIKAMKGGTAVRLFPHFVSFSPTGPTAYHIPLWLAAWSGNGGIRESGPQLDAGCSGSQPFLYARMNRLQSRSTPGCYARPSRSEFGSL